MQDTGAPVVAREPELAVLSEFLGVDPRAQALVITGGPGIGKTTLWDAGVASARARGMRVLTARPGSAETRLAFAALADLLAEVDLRALAGLPAPQLHALEVALLRVEPGGPPPEARAIAAGVLGALRALASPARLLVAIDDVPWLDSPSADALAFATRRLAGHPVRFLLTQRSGGASRFDEALEPGRPERLEVGGLSFGAIRSLLSERLDLNLPRRVMRRTFEAAQGNPLFALQLGRMLMERGLPEIGQPIAAPDTVEDLLGVHVARLPAGSRRLLLAVALSDDLHTSQLASIGEPGDLDDALAAGLLVVDRDRVRPSHPLIAAVARERSRSGERRALHLELARVTSDAGRQARHVALASERPDAELAATLAAAADRAVARGAAEDAVELAEHALRLTPGERGERTERLLALGEHLTKAGAEQRVTDLLEPELSSLPRGRARVRAYLLLADGGTVTSVPDHADLLRRAFAESTDHPALRAAVLARQVEHTAVGCVERIEAAEAWALEAVEAARGVDPEVERLALHGLGWVLGLRGRPVAALRERYRSIGDGTYQLYRSLDRVAAVRLAWRGEAEAARAALTRLLALADERGEAFSYAVLSLHLCELELSAGGFDAAGRTLDDWEQSRDEELLVAPLHERCRALLAAGRGLPDEAERWAAAAIAGAEATGVRWDWLEALRARGSAELFRGEPERAANSLRGVWEHTRREGIDEPGVFPVAPDLVEALVTMGDREEAGAVADRLRELGERQRHPWALATAGRCHALVSLSRDAKDPEAPRALQDAAEAYRALGLRFDHARSLLLLGRAQRRRRSWAAARRSLEAAAAAFGAIGSPGWAERARSELDRVGARRPPAAGELTPAERGAVQLAAEGLSNQEIAHRLFVTVHTVEVHLSHAYAKLGVRSRSQLAGRLAGRTQRPKD